MHIPILVLPGPGKIWQSANSCSYYFVSNGIGIETSQEYARILFTAGARTVWLSIHGFGQSTNFRRNISKCTAGPPNEVNPREPVRFNVSTSLCRKGRGIEGVLLCQPTCLLGVVCMFSSTIFFRFLGSQPFFAA